MKGFEITSVGHCRYDQACYTLFHEFCHQRRRRALGRDSRPGRRAPPPRRRHHRRAAHRSQRDRPRADPPPAAADGAAPRGGLRGGRHPDRLREHRASRKLYRRDAGSHRLGDQQGLQPRRRRHLFGHGRRVRSKGRSWACRASPCRSSGRPATYDFGPSAAAAATIAALVLRERLCAADVPEPERPAGKPKGFKLTVQAKRNHVTIVDERCDPRGKRVLLDRGRGERLGAARPVGLPGGARRVRVGHAAAARHDRPRRVQASWKSCRSTSRPGPDAGNVSVPAGCHFRVHHLGKIFLQVRQLRQIVVDNVRVGGITIEKVLMVGLGGVEAVERDHLGDDRRA